MRRVPPIFLATMTVALFWSSASAAQETITYSYDAIGRLTTVLRVRTSGTTTTTYAYDDASNRTSKVIDAPSAMEARDVPPPEAAPSAEEPGDDDSDGQSPE